jgi:hypothetical protein
MKGGGSAALYKQFPKFLKTGSVPFCFPNPFSFPHF